ncbi:hypothetical protein F5Y15DRAFT_419307 [Xylariaceae sp. FL0016]|nr:hypothetical protein F5Y15DRAFT_419307 [Xylariaceae sp. FL0016]
MAEIFRPKHYVMEYNDTRDIEHVAGLWVHPKESFNPEGYRDDEIILSFSATQHPYILGDYDTEAIYFGPDSPMNKIAAVHYRPISQLDMEIEKPGLKRIILKTSCDWIGPFLTKNGHAIMEKGKLDFDWGEHNPEIAAWRKWVVLKKLKPFLDHLLHKTASYRYGFLEGSGCVYGLLSGNGKRRNKILLTDHEAVRERRETSESAPLLYGFSQMPFVSLNVGARMDLHRYWGSLNNLIRGK